MIHRYHVGDARDEGALAATYQQASALAIRPRPMTVILNAHLFRKMMQAQRNMMRHLRNRKRRSAGSRRRALYWAREFKKWSGLVIERADVKETKP